MTTFRYPILANDQFYHIFNRGVERRDIFLDKRDYQRALSTFKFYSYTNLSLKYSKFLVLPKDKKSKFLEATFIDKNALIETIAYCLMPNHFHFLVKQLKDDGISKTFSNFSNSFTKFFNTKNERVGPLLQGLFKAVRVETEEQLVHLSRYIHLNPVASFLIKEKELITYPWSSFQEYLGITDDKFSKTEYVLGGFKSVDDYKQFVFDQISYAQNLEKIKHLGLDTDRLNF